MVSPIAYDPFRNIKLVKAVEKHPFLYSDTKRYRHRNAVAEVWKKIAEEVGDTDVHCKDRWQNLKNSYTRYLREKRTKSVTPYYLADHMMFLDPYIVLGRSRGSKPKSVSGNVSSTDMSLTPRSLDKDDDNDNNMSIGYIDKSSSGGADVLVNKENSSTSSKPAIKTSDTIGLVRAASGKYARRKLHEKF